MRAFTLVEILIIVVILSILAAIALPMFQSQSQQAKEAAAKDNLRILRQQIELYAIQHNDVPPGYSEGGSGVPLEAAFYTDLVDGNYISERPKNPFNNLTTVNIIGDGDSLPAEATGGYGWVYQPLTKTIKLDWPGTDANGVRYYDY